MYSHVKFSFSRKTAFALSFFICIFAFLLCIDVAFAATVNYYVDPTGTDDGSHGTASGTDAWATIQYAVNNVANPTTDVVIINVAAGIYTTGNNDIDIDRNFLDLTISGAGADLTIVQPHADPSSATDRNFDIDYEVDVTIENMTIRYGRTSAMGGAIECSASNLTLNDVIIYNNSTSGGTGYVGAVYARDNLTVENSTFYDNGGSYSSAIYGPGSGNTVIITNSTFYNNPGSAGSIYLNGAISYWTNVIVTKGTGVGVLFQGSSPQYMENCIFADNSGYDIDYYNYYSTVYASNTIIGVEATDGSAPFIINGVNENIDIDNDALSTINIKEQLSVNGSANNTLTLALEEGSIAINAGTNVTNGIIAVPSTDQRGVARVSTVDIGPFEYEGSDSSDPLFSSITLASDDSYVDIVFDEGVYDTSGGSGGMEASDFTISVSTGYGEVTSATVTSVKALDGTNPVGGETTLRLYISLTGTKRGVETLTFYPADGSSIYDASGNSMYQNASTDSVILGGSYVYYVDLLGTDDSSHGTSSGANAWATIQYAIDSVSNPTYVPIVINISGDTYTLDNDDINIARNFIDLTLSGDQASTTIIQAHSNFASSTSRNFNIDYTEYVTLEDMTIRYGDATYSGGIYANSSSLTIRRCYVYSNNSTGMSYGGGLWTSRGDLLIEDTTFDSNTGTYISGAYISGDTLVIKNSTFYNNTGSTYGSVYVGSPDEDVYIFNSIFGGGQEFLIQGSQDVYIRNSIFIDNAGMDIEYYNYFGTVYAQNTIIGYEDTDGSAPYITNGVNGNVVYNTTTTLTDINISTSLAMNDSVNGVMTLALLTGSPAINAGANATIGNYSTPSLDQRGATRVASMDIGPYEYNGVAGAPYITEFYPADNSTGIAVDSNLALYFSEIVDAEAGGDNDIIIKKASDDSTVETIDAQDAKVSGSGSAIISINPATTLDEKTEYYVLVGVDAFDDINSNSFAGVSTSSWSFTTTDSTAPSVSSFLPSDNAISVNEDSNFEITFDEAINVGSGNIILYKTSDDSLIETVDITGVSVTASGTTALIIDLTTTLDSNTEYYFMMDSTAIDDTSGNSYAGITASTTWSFTTGDTIAPTISSLLPADNATNIGVNGTFEIDFNEAIATSSGNITLYKTSDDSVVETIDITSSLVTASGTTALIIDPSTTLESETEYYFIIDSTAIDDLNTNSFLGITASTTWSFTTTDVNNPTVVSFSPSDNSTNISTTTNLVMTFNEVVATSSSNILIYKTDDDSLVESISATSSQISGVSTSTITINPSVTLAEETEYYVIVESTVFDDLSGNSYAGITASTTWSFTTGDFTNPTISVLSPLDNTSDVTVTSNLVITFDENIATSSGNIKIYKTSDDSLVETIDVTGSQLTSNGTTQITVNPTANFSYATGYYIVIETSAFDDTSGNSFSGVTLATIWNFTTESAPTCPVLANAATYNAYPTCGVATCNSGYTLTSGACVANSTGSSNSQIGVPVAIGEGIIDVAIGMNKNRDIGNVLDKGVNAIMYLNSNASFSAVVSHSKKIQKHSLKIKDMDLYKNVVRVLIQSEPQEFDLKLNETRLVDLDFDGINDIEVSFVNLVTNKAEITIKELLTDVSLEVIDDDCEELLKIFNSDLYEKLKGKILLKVESKGEAYYVNSKNNNMHYLGRPIDAFNIMKDQGLGISEENFNLFDGYAPCRLAGSILLRAEANGEAYYVNPDDNKMYYLGRPLDAFNIMKDLGLGISDDDFERL